MERWQQKGRKVVFSALNCQWKGPAKTRSWITLLEWLILLIKMVLRNSRAIYLLLFLDGSRKWVQCGLVCLFCPLLFFFWVFLFFFFLYPHPSFFVYFSVRVLFCYWVIWWWMASFVFFDFVYLVINAKVLFVILFMRCSN